MDHDFLAKAAGAFAYMVSEHILGKTKFGSWIGLAKAALWFILVNTGKVLSKVVKGKNSSGGTNGNQ